MWILLLLIRVVLGIFCCIWGVELINNSVPLMFRGMNVNTNVGTGWILLGVAAVFFISSIVTIVKKNSKKTNVYKGKF